MKSKKSKVLEPQPQLSQLAGDKKMHKEKEFHMSQRELLLLQEQKAKKREAMILSIKKKTGQFFMLLFALAVIFSMIALPLLIVFS